MNFYDFIASQVREACESKNYQHTHDRVWFNSVTRKLELEEICINEYGSSYGRNIGFTAIVPDDIEIPAELISSTKELVWADYDDLPINYGSGVKNQSIHRPKFR